MANEKGKSGSTKGVAALPQSYRSEYRRFRRRPTTQESKGSPSKKKASTAADEQESAVPPAEINEASEMNTQQKEKKTAKCKYYNREKGCRLGDGCLFRHVDSPRTRAAKDAAAHREIFGSREGDHGIVRCPVLPPTQNERRPAFIPPIPTVKREEEGSDCQLAIKNAEVSYFRRRYPACMVEEDDGQTSIFFNFDVTDPHWAFDIKSLHILLSLPPSYPISAPLIACPSSHNPNLPHTLISFIGRVFTEEIQHSHAEMSSKDAFQSMGKWLLRTIDRRIFDVFVEGLKRTKLVFDAEKAGISLVMPTSQMTLQEIDEEKKENEDGREEEKEGVEEEEESTETEEDGAEKNTDTPSSSRETKKKPAIEVVVSWNDSSRNTASLEAEVLCLLVKCARCGEVREEERKVDGKRTSKRCTKCNVAQSIVLDSSLVHSFSSVLAHLSCSACRPVDVLLLRSRLSFACLACNRIDQVQNLNYGVPHKSWCRGCHTLCEFTISSMRFRGDHEQNEDREVAGSLPKIRKKTTVTAQSVQPGGPLPDLGTCKHYKKSYRWFRFPCCGRLYPCDTCHEEKKGDGHEMKIANRMVCGHCSHEQQLVAGKPCSNCKESVIRVKTRFWEGGAGCRDQATMSRNDAKKYANSRMKTVAKKKADDLLVKKK